MTNAVRRLSFSAISALVIAILMLCIAPARALAHEAISGTTGSGTANDPVYVNTWPEFKAALELKETFTFALRTRAGT